MHELFITSHCFQNIIRMLFVDFSSKAFDLINHNILLEDKFVNSDVPEHVVVWSTRLFNNRKKSVKIDESAMHLVHLQLELELHKAQCQLWTQ